jgi:hypothetical protein
MRTLRHIDHKVKVKLPLEPTLEAWVSKNVTYMGLSTLQDLGMDPPSHLGSLD